MEGNWQNIKMVAADLDGTLLYHSGKVTGKTKQVIRDLRKKGIKFGVCSGRPAIGLVEKLKDWGIDQDVDFILGCNGGMLLLGEDIRSLQKIPAKEIPVLFQAFDGYSVAFAEYENKTMLCTRSNPIVRRMASRNNLRFVKTDKNALIRPALKLMVIGMPWVISKWLKDAPRPAGVRMFRSGPFLIEIVHHQLSKLEGIREMAKIYNIGLDQVVTFGNDNNDLEMLAGTVGVAMDNALDNVKKAASYVTDSNKKDGVARFIEKHLL